MDDLIDFMVRFANEHAFSLQELAARIRERLLAKPGDQLLIVEPEKEIGNLMPEENRRVVGQAPPACTVLPACNTIRMPVQRHDAVL